MTGYKHAYVLMIAFVLLIAVTDITVSRIRIRKRKDSEIIVLNKKLSIMGLIYLGLLILWIFLAAKNFLEVYRILKKDYIDSVFQMFDLQYMESISEGFLNNKEYYMHLETSYYLSSMTKRLYWMALTLSMCVTCFYRGVLGTIIYEEGISVSDVFHKWEKFEGYYSCGPYKKSFNEETYYKFIFKLPKFYDLDKTLVLNVDSEDKDAVEKAVSLYVLKTEEQ